MDGGTLRSTCSLTRSRERAGTRTTIACDILYEIDPPEIEAFERFARRWIEWWGATATHHGYFLPAEGASDIAYAVSSFLSC